MLIEHLMSYRLNKKVVYACPKLLCVRVLLVSNESPSGRLKAKVAVVAFC
jgi:hypothetical protein